MAFSLSSTHFPGYTLFAPYTECGILYKETLNVTHITPRRYHRDTNRKNLTLVSGITYHEKGKQIAIHSYYRPPYNGDGHEILQRTDGDVSVYGGDLNLHHHTWGSIKDSSIAMNYVDLLHQAELKIVNNGSPTRWDEAHKKEANIDVTLVSNNAHISDWKTIVDRSGSLSDHYFIRYKLHLSDIHGRDPSRRSWNLRSKRWRHYRNSMKFISLDFAERIREIDEAFHDRRRTPAIRETYTAMINKLVEELTHHLTMAASSSIGYHYHHEGHKPWWNQRIASTKNKCKFFSRKKARYILRHRHNRMVHGAPAHVEGH
eukprot:292261_1